MLSLTRILDNATTAYFVEWLTYATLRVDEQPILADDGNYRLETVRALTPTLPDESASLTMYAIHYSNHGDLPYRVSVMTFDVIPVPNTTHRCHLHVSCHQPAIRLYFEHLCERIAVTWPGQPSGSNLRQPHRKRGQRTRYSREALITAARTYIATHESPLLADFQDHGYINAKGEIERIPSRSWSRYTAKYGFTWSELVEDCQRSQSD